MAYLLLVSLIWAFPFGLMGHLIAGSGLTPEVLPLLRLLLALAVFAPFLRIGTLTTPERWRLAGIGAVQFGLMYVLLFASFGYLQAYQVALFTVMTPFYVALFFDGLERRFHPRRVLLAGMAVAGAALVESGNWSEGAEAAGLLIGFALVQGSNLCFAAGQVAYKRFRQTRADLRDAQLYGLLYAGAVGAGALYALANAPPGETLRALARLDWEDAGILLYLGVISSGLCFFWWNRGAVRTRPGTLAVFNNLKVPLAVVATLVFFGGTVEWPRLLSGGGLVIAALILAERSRPAGRPHARTHVLPSISRDRSD